MNGLVSEETVLPCQWRGETRKTCIKQVDEGQISTIKRLRS